MQGAYASTLRFQIESGSSFMTMSDPKGDPVDNLNQKEKPLLLHFKKVALVPMWATDLIASMLKVRLL